jgi:predicted porin
LDDSDYAHTTFNHPSLSVQEKTMQQKIIALALAGLSGAALAQSNVTIYGIADATFDVINVSGGAANTPSFGRVATNGSRIGFKGSEALGNGLTAFFQYESDVKFDEAGALGTARDSFVGASSAFGRITLGNLSGPSRVFANTLDVNAGADGIGSNQAILGKAGGVLAGIKLDGASGSFSAPRIAPSTTRSGGTVGIFDNRFANAISYASPEFSGLLFTAQYAANENKDELAATRINTSAYDLGLIYSNGPLFAGLTHGEARLRNQDDGAAASMTSAMPACACSGRRTASRRTPIRWPGAPPPPTASISSKPSGAPAAPSTLPPTAS